MTISKILVACDFSDPASRGLDMALDLSQKLGAKLELLHVHPELYGGRADVAAGLPWPPPEQTERYLRFVEDELRRVIREKNPAAAEKAGYHIQRGEPAQRILAFTKEIGADLVIVGSTGKGAVERFMLGSASQTVLRESPVPVLVVR